MRLQLKKIKATRLPVDVFIYFPKEKSFFFLDDFEIGEKKVELIFEPKFDKCIIREVNKNSYLYIVENYTTPEIITNN